MSSVPVLPAQDARPTSSAATKKVVDRKGAQIAQKRHSPSDTLEARCRSVIVANLERFPPSSFRLLSEDSWDDIVRERHEKTTPSAGTGGLDGTGRLLPSVSDRYMTETEQVNPQFADSTVADRLVWKDCVEYRFRSGGLTRPAALYYPWPVLVNKLKRSGDGLLELLNSDKPPERKQELLERYVQTLSESPMNVALLQASDVGKSVKKFIKACTKQTPSSLDVHTERPVRGPQSAKVKNAVSPLAQLEQTLQKWKHMAANSGVQIQTNDGKGTNEQSGQNDQQEDLCLAESCQTWRELFSVLQQREAKRRASQGARMRERRSDLAAGRPRIVKVRPAKSRHDNMLDRADKKKGLATSSFSVTPAFASGNSKMKALKKESRIAATLQKSSARPDPKKKNSFGAAVAFATNANPSSSPKRRAGQVVPLAGGKRMKVPTAKAWKRPFHGSKR